MKKMVKKNGGIKNWSKDDRPREKLLQYGEQSLSNAELLAILIRNGTVGKSAIDMSRELLQEFKSLGAINSLEIAELKKIPGISDAKICQIKVAMNL